MRIIRNWIGVLCISCFLSHTAQANPASTDYVDKRFLALSSQLQTMTKELESLTHHVGEIFQGGIIFWVDSSQQHGLIASLTDVTGDVGIAWRNGEGGDRIVNAQAQGLGAGETNTRLIIAEQTIDQQDGQFAALLAANYQDLANGKPCNTPMSPTEACYGGWYLPSVFELMLLYHNLKITNLGKLNDSAYWSSSEQDTTSAWLLDFGSGEIYIRDKSTLAGVRAIRSF